MKKLLFVFAALFLASAHEVVAQTRTPVVEIVPYKKNYIQNSAMDFNQRYGTTAANMTTADYAYQLDRFKTRAAGTFTGTPTIQRYETSPNGLTRYTMLMVGNAANNTAAYYVHQQIESINARELSGKKVSLSAWMNTDTGSSSVTPALYYMTTIDGTSTVQINDTNLTAKTLTPGWTKFTWNNITLPGNVSNGILFRLMIGNMTSGTRYHHVTQIMLNEGSLVAPWNLAGGDVAGEQIKVWRYAQCQSVDGAVIAICQPNSTTSGICVYTPPVPFRTAPAMTHPANVFFLVRADGTGTPGMNIGSPTYNGTMVRFNFSGTTSMVAGYMATLILNGSTPYCYDAEHN